MHYLISLDGLRTPNKGINQRNLKIWANVADKIWLYLNISEWELIFGRAVKVISSLGVHSPCIRSCDKCLIFCKSSSKNCFIGKINSILRICWWLATLSLARDRYPWEGSTVHSTTRSSSTGFIYILVHSHFDLVILLLVQWLFIYQFRCHFV